MWKLCRVCGLREDQHHQFEPSMPPGCVCNSGEWGDDVREPCAEYVGEGDERCRRCEHDRECHQAPNVGIEPPERSARMTG